MPKASYVTYGGFTEFLMYSINGAAPIINWYTTPDHKRWKVQVKDMMVKDASGSTYTHLDPMNLGGI